MVLPLESTEIVWTEFCTRQTARACTKISEMTAISTAETATALLGTDSTPALTASMTMPHQPHCQCRPAGSIRTRVAYALDKLGNGFVLRLDTAEKPLRK